MNATWLNHVEPACFEVMNRTCAVVMSLINFIYYVYVYYRFLVVFWLLPLFRIIFPNFWRRLGSWDYQGGCVDSWRSVLGGSWSLALLVAVAVAFPFPADLFTCSVKMVSCLLEACVRFGCKPSFRESPTVWDLASLEDVGGFFKHPDTEMTVRWCPKRLHAEIRLSGL